MHIIFKPFLVLKQLKIDIIDIKLVLQKLLITFSKILKLFFHSLNIFRTTELNQYFIHLFQNIPVDKCSFDIKTVSRSLSRVRAMVGS